MATGKHSKPKGSRTRNQAQQARPQQAAPQQQRPQQAQARQARPQHAKPQQAERPSTAAQAPVQPVVQSAPRRSSERVGAKRRRSGSKTPIAALVMILIAVAAGIGIFYALNYEAPGDVHEGEKIIVEVPQGSTSGQIAQLLKDKGVISTCKDFSKRVSELDQASSLKSGTYRFTGGEEIDQIIEDLASGNTGYALTIPEGYTLKQIAAAVSESTDVDGDEFYEIAHTKATDYAARYPFLKNCYKGSMEGFLFPETYHVDFDATPASLVDQMLAQFQKEIQSIDMTYANSKNLDVYDVTTLASIVEKESRMSDDKAGIASVFYNRLHAQINLGSDVTTYYAVGKEMTEELTKKDLASTSPYNTRNAANKGLPPGAICNPGIEALNAAANPSKDDNLYFFWSEKNKKTMFYKTQAEFDAAWAKYGS